MTNKWMLLLGAGVLVAAARPSFAQTAATALAGLGNDVIDVRRAVADAVVFLRAPGLDGVEAIAQQLTDLRRNEDWRVATLIEELRLQAGNGLPHARPDPGPPSTDGDLIELLIEQKPNRVVHHTLATVCLMRALARIGSTPAIRQLVLIASDLGGAFRPELSRELKQLDEQATAALIEARGNPSLEIRTWAKDALEALGKRTPGDSVQTTNDRVLVDVLRAYAAIQDLDALPVILSFVNSDRTHVRAAAREATLAFGQHALGKLRATYAALTGERLPDDMYAAVVAHKLFDAYDHYRLRDVYVLLDQGLAKQRAGDIEGAIVDFDNVLARQPLLDRGAEIVPAYVAYAMGIERTDRQRALDYLRQALRLEGSFRAQSAPNQEVNDGPVGSNHVRSEIQYVEGEELLARGVVDTSPFERAMALDPINPHVLARLDLFRASNASRRLHEGRLAIAVATAGLSLITLGLFALRAPRYRGVSKRRGRR